MRKLLFSLIVLLACNQVFAAERVLKFQWRFIGSTPGIDYLNKMQVFFDGKPGSFSTGVQQSDLGEMFVYVPDSTKKVKFVNFAYYDGNWETYSLENRYSFDGDFEFEYTPEVAIILLTLDLESKQVYGSVQNEEGTELDIKANRLTLAQSTMLTINWDFSKSTNHSKLPTRMMVYLDKQLVCYSDQGKQEIGGKLVCYLPKGKHTVTVVNEYFEKGYWLETSKANKCTLDAMAEKELVVKDHFFLEMHFGETNESSIIRWK